MILVSGLAIHEGRVACNDRQQHTMLEMPRDVRYAAAWAGSTCRLVMLMSVHSLHMLIILNNDMFSKWQALQNAKAGHAEPSLMNFGKCNNANQQNWQQD